MVTLSGENCGRPVFQGSSGSSVILGSNRDHWRGVENLVNENEKIKDLARRFKWAEGRVLRDRPPERRVEWQVTHCSSCQKRVEYSPKKKNWDRKLLCPHCGRVFEVPRLDWFVK